MKIISVQHIRQQVLTRISVNKFMCINVLKYFTAVSFILHLSMISVTLFLHYSIDISSLSHTYPTSLYDMGYRWDIYGISMGYLRDNLNKMMDRCRMRYGFEEFGGTFRVLCSAFRVVGTEGFEGFECLKV